MDLYAHQTEQRHTDGRYQANDPAPFHAAKLPVPQALDQA
jgi:hypothetical protein